MDAGLLQRFMCLLNCVRTHVCWTDHACHLVPIPQLHQVRPWLLLEMHLFMPHVREAQ